MELLDWYMKGFNDELDGKADSSSIKDKVEKRAYEIGRDDAIIGDDLPSHDNRSSDEILRQILQKNN